MARLPDINARRPAPRAAGPAAAPNIPGSATFSGQQQGLMILGQAGQVLGQAMQKEQIKEDTLRAEDAFNQLQKKRLELTSGENGFSNIKGGNVANQPVYKNYDEQFDQAVDEISQSLDNDDQRKRFGSRAAVSKTQYSVDLANHVQREKNVYAKQVYEGGKAVELQNAAENWSQPGAIKFSIERTKRLIEQQSEREGWAKDMTKAATKAAVSNIHLAVIENAIANEEAEYASEYFSKHKKTIDSTQHDDVTKLIRQSTLRSLSQSVADDIMAEDISEADALAKVRKQYKGDEEAAIVSAIKTRYVESRAKKEESQRNATDQAWEIYNNAVDSGSSDPYNQIPVNILESMDQKSRAVLKGRQNGKTAKNGSGDYYALRLMMKDNPEQFRRLDLRQYNLSPGDFKEMVKAQTDPVEIDYFDSETSIVNQGLFAIGLDKNNLTEDNAEGKKARSFANAVRREQEIYQRQTGKKMDNKQFKDAVDRLAIEVIRKKKPIFGEAFHDWTNPDFLPEWMTEPRGEEETPAGVLEIEGIPNERIDEYAKALKDAGYPVTEENIKKLHKESM